MAKEWSRDDILYALLEWQEKHGAQPRSNDWMTSGGDAHPAVATVYKHFGSWDEAIRQAGMTPYTRPRIEFDEKLARRLRREGVTDREICQRLGISKEIIRKRLGPRPKPLPVGKKRSREQRIADLQNALKEGG